MNPIWIDNSVMIIYCMFSINSIAPQILTGQEELHPQDCSVLELELKTVREELEKMSQVRNHFIFYLV
jgi:hypothetical protein